MLDLFRRLTGENADPASPGVLIERINLKKGELEKVRAIR